MTENERMIYVIEHRMDEKIACFADRCSERIDDEMISYFTKQMIRWKRSILRNDLTIDNLSHILRVLRSDTMFGTQIMYDFRKLYWAYGKYPSVMIDYFKGFYSKSKPEE